MHYKKVLLQSDFPTPLAHPYLYMLDFCIPVSQKGKLTTKCWLFMGCNVKDQKTPLRSGDPQVEGLRKSRLSTKWQALSKKVNTRKALYRHLYGTQVLPRCSGNFNEDEFGLFVYINSYYSNVSWCEYIDLCCLFKFVWVRGMNPYPLFTNCALSVMAGLNQI